ncbi:MAG: hypothetical protein JW715_06105 [Sedimentisphaerales bacterium]|nr:hypothetical protein [Sedimentisphaerales bacterium]
MVSHNISFFMLPVLILLLSAAIALLVLFVWLCIKKPQVAAIMALVLLVLFASFFVLRLGTRRSIVRQQAIPLLPSATQEPVYINTAIWSPGVEDEFIADIYPSKKSAVSSLGRQLSKYISYITEADSPEEIIVYRNSQDIELVEELKEVLAKLYPAIKCRIELGNPTQAENKIGVYFFMKYSAQPVSWSDSSGNKGTAGTIQGNILANHQQQATVNVNFVEKPWIEDFSGFINRQPHQQLIIARSSESCLTEAEANRQAMENACSQVGPLLTNLQDPIQLSSSDILENGLIADRFVQSFEGSAGKIWRQALLIDTSAEKLTRLVRSKLNMARARKHNLAKMFISFTGMLVLIIVAYVFLNAATKGYYSWSLRIAGIVLIAIIIILFFA